MFSYVIRRILLAIPVLLGVIIIIFTITYFTPGEPAYNVLGGNPTEEQVAEWNASVGLDKPLIVQLFNYIRDVVTKFDFGVSYVTNEPVTKLLLERLPVSLKLGLISTLLSVLISVPLGILAAIKQNSALDYMTTTVALFGASMPGFWLALLLMLLFSVKLGWLPASGTGTFAHWILPCFTSALMPIATMMRTTRSSVLEVTRQDYITTAVAKGQQESKIVTKHILRNSMIPVVTIIGISLSGALTGSLIVETVFNMSGLGLLLTTAISYRNYPIIRGCTIFYAAIVCLLNILVDVIYTVIDPRIKAQFLRKRKRARHKAAKGEGT